LDLITKKSKEHQSQYHLVTTPVYWTLSLMSTYRDSIIFLYTNPIL